MKPLMRIRWPRELLDYVQGVTPQAMSTSETGSSSREHVIVEPDDLIWCTPTASVKSYWELVELVAHLASLNTRYRLYFRGHDRVPRKASGLGNALTPTIWRDGPKKPPFLERVERLVDATNLLTDRYLDIGASPSRFIARNMERNPLTQWALLQHYCVCDTPLLDMTNSLRVACSFALDRRKVGYLVILGMPHASEIVSTNNRQGIVMIDLLGVAPYTAMRPLLQQGYLACTTEWWNFWAKATAMDWSARGPVDYRRLGEVAALKESPMEFSERIVAIHKLEDHGRFWRSGTSGPIAHERLYPREDPFLKFLDGVGLVTGPVADAHRPDPRTRRRANAKLLSRLASEGEMPLSPETLKTLLQSLMT